MQDLPVFEHAKRNSDGDLIVQKENRLGTHDVNMSKMFEPGKRKTSNVDMLVTEARLADKKGPLANPAFPMGEDTADKALARIDSEGIDPAWMSGPASNVY